MKFTTIAVTFGTIATLLLAAAPARAQSEAFTTGFGATAATALTPRPMTAALATCFNCHDCTFQPDKKWLSNSGPSNIKVEGEEGCHVAAHCLDPGPDCGITLMNAFAELRRSPNSKEAWAEFLREHRDNVEYVSATQTLLVWSTCGPRPEIVGSLNVPADLRYLTEATVSADPVQ